MRLGRFWHHWSIGRRMVFISMLPVAYLSVRLMRWWSQLVALSQRPAFKRAKT